MRVSRIKAPSRAWGGNPIVTPFSPSAKRTKKQESGSEAFLIPRTLLKTATYGCKATLGCPRNATPGCKATLGCVLNATPGCNTTPGYHRNTTHRCKATLGCPLNATFEDMGLCPIAPPKGFPLALWKPSGANTSFFLEISVLLAWEFLFLNCNHQMQSNHRLSSECNPWMQYNPGLSSNCNHRMQYNPRLSSQCTPRMQSNPRLSSNCNHQMQTAFRLQK